MSTKVLELKNILAQDGPAAFISNTWDTYNNQRQGQIDKWLELRNYIFATDTTTTTNAQLPWKNSTTLPKLCQIRDNLHSNYISALFPNDNWLKWEAYTKDSATHEKAKVIQAYMGNKAREGGFYNEISRSIYDYIDYGNAFLTVDFEKNVKVMDDGERIPQFIDPRS